MVDWGGQGCPTTSRYPDQDPSRHWTLAGVHSEEWGLTGGGNWKFVREERSRELQHTMCLELPSCLLDALVAVFSFLQPERSVPEDSLAERPGVSLSSPNFTAPQSSEGVCRCKGEGQEPRSPPALGGTHLGVPPSLSGSLGGPGAADPSQAPCIPGGFINTPHTRVWPDDFSFLWPACL